jgi:hypothetical protein
VSRCTEPLSAALTGTQGNAYRGPARPRVSYASLSERLLNEVRPSPENDRLYRPIRDDAEIVALADSIRRLGVREPIVITADGWILSGHRRHAAARLAGLETIPCRVEPIRREDDPDGFVVLLREHNRQRDKSLDEKLREEMVTVDPGEAYTSLIEFRREKSQVDLPPIEIGDPPQRTGALCYLCQKEQRGRA